MRKLLESCPTCGGPLYITEVRCERCDTEVRSRYEPCPFCRLTPEQMNFILLFVQSRGNLSDVEKALGVSYPTIRGKLDEIIRIISTESGSKAAEVSTNSAISTPSSAPTRSTLEANRRREILDQIASGKLSVTDGLAALRGEERRDG